MSVIIETNVYHVLYGNMQKKDNIKSVMAERVFKNAQKTSDQ